MTGKTVLIDVTRLIWRAWRGRKATGIDRVCLAYLENFRGNGLAVIQRKGLQTVLSRKHSARLFDLLLASKGASRFSLALTIARAIPSARRAPPIVGMLYFNVGHTGLDEDSLTRWIERYRIKALYLIHDLIPITHPIYCRPGEAERHRRRVRNALRSASAVICNSQATCDELTAFAKSEDLPMPCTTISWLAGFQSFASVGPKRLDRPYCVSVGTIEARKNHSTLLEAWARLYHEQAEETPVLVIIGGRGWKAEHVFQILDAPGELRNVIREVGECEDDELAAWIAGAEALLMPSHVEGFGLPVIEAMQLGTPVVASDLPVFREIVGDLPIYVEPNDTAEWMNNIKALCAGGQLTSQIRQRSASYAAPTWAQHFEEVEALAARL